MLRIIVSIISLFIASGLYAGKKDICNISFDLAGNGNSYVSLAYHLGDRQYIKDTIYTDDKGHALYRKQEALEKGLYMIIFPDNNLFEMIISDDQEFSISCNVEDIINTLSFTGSGENSAFIKYRKKWMKFQDEATELRKSLNNQTSRDSIDIIKKQLTSMEREILGYIEETAQKYQDSLLSAMLYAMLPIEIPEFDIPLNTANSDSLRWIMGYHYNKDHFFDNTRLDDPRLIRTPILHNKLKTFFTNVVIQAPDSLMPEVKKIISIAETNHETFRYVIAFLFNHFRESQIMGHDAIVVMIAEEYYLSGTVDWVDEKFLDELKKDVAMIKPNLIGKKAVNITMDTFSGVRKSLYDINSEFTILYFWEPNCGHCKTVTPELKDFYSRHRNGEIEVFSVCTQDNKKEWENYIIENGLEWINGWDPVRSTGYAYYYNVRATPLIYVLNKNKEIIAKKLPVSRLEEFISQYRRMNNY